MNLTLSIQTDPRYDLKIGLTGGNIFGIYIQFQDKNPFGRAGDRIVSDHLMDLGAAVKVNRSIKISG